MEAAQSAFAAEGISASLEQIAREAGVGIGTLYRHFPTRGDLIAAVYRNEVEKLADAGEALAKTEAPLEGLRQLLRQFVDHLGTKLLLADALKTLIIDQSELYAASAERLSASMSGMLKRAAKNGEIAETDIDPLDLLRAVGGLLIEEGGPEREAAARQMIELLINGLRAR